MGSRSDEPGLQALKDNTPPGKCIAGCGRNLKRNLKGREPNTCGAEKCIKKYRRNYIKDYRNDIYHAGK